MRSQVHRESKISQIHPYRNMNRLVLSCFAIAGMLSLTNCHTVEERDHHRHDGGSTTTTTTTEETFVRRPASSIVETQTVRSY
jgi:hypothetical protein